MGLSQDVLPLRMVQGGHLGLVSSSWYIPGCLNGKMVHLDGQNLHWTFSGMLDNPQ